MVEDHDNHRPEVSVVVPVYNVQDYLGQCLDSVLCQSDVDLEIVCVDDCGTDNSRDILEEYRARDSRIRVITHSQNRGLSAARNTGIENARGEFVVFLDSDDLLNPDKLSLQVRAIRRDRADMVYFHTDLLWERFPGDPSPTQSFNPPEHVLFNQELRRTNLLNYPALLHATSSWSYIYSADFLRRHSIRYDEHLKRWEDRAFWTRVARLARTVSIVPVSARKYRQRSESITKGAQDPEHLWMMLRQLNIILDEFELFKHEHKECDTFVHSKYLHSYVAFRVTSWFLNAVNKMEDRQYQEALVEGACELFERLDWSTVDLRAVEGFTRRLQIDLDRTALLCALLRMRRVQQVIKVLDAGCLPLPDLIEAEQLFECEYPISRKRFEESASDVLPLDSVSPDVWMKEASLVVHIGFRKTGTTYIQRAFDLNRDLLLASGVLFPDAGLDRTDSRGGRPGACAGHLGFIELVRNREKRRDLWQDVRREMEGYDVRTIFISAENFLHEYSAIDLQSVRKTFAGFKQVRFVVSLRRPDRWIESLYKELVCGGWKGETRTFSAFLVEDWQQMNFAARLAPWISEFGRDAFDAVSVDLHTDEVDGVRAMLDILRKRTGAGPDPKMVAGWRRPSDAEAYSSPKAELVEAIRLLNNAKKPSAPYRREVAWLLEKWNNTGGLLDFSLLDAEAQTRIGTEMMPNYSGLLQSFGLEVPFADSDSALIDPRGKSIPAPQTRVASMIMEDVMRLSRRLPDQDHAQHFFRRIYSKGMPKPAAAAPPRISVRERFVATLILKPVLAIWNLASSETKETWRTRAKTAFGSHYVDRIVQLARKASGPATER